MRRKLLAVAIGLVVAVPLGESATAGAAGGPILPGPAYDPTGATAPSGGDRYVTLFGANPPLIARVQQDGGRVLDSQSFGRFAIPAVTINGSAGGLSADGSTLVLAPTRSGLRRPETTFKVIEARRLRMRKLLRLDGSFTFDAISPDGSRVYVIEYPSAPDTTRYSVRAVNAHTGRLLPEPIVDPKEPPGEMRGYPLQRVGSPDGRWAYTLYDGAQHPFIHALDTERGQAVCIDLDGLNSNAAYRSRLTSNPDGSELTVSDRKRGPLALVDTATFEVSEPAEPDAGGSGFPWPAVALVPLALAASLLLARTIRRRRLAPGGAR